MTEDTVTLIIKPDNKKIQIKKGANLLDAIVSNGISVESVCGGIGDCGRCKVIINDFHKPNTIFSKEDLRFLTKDELDKGYRLSCRLNVDRDLTITIPDESRTGTHQILTKTIESKPDKIESNCKKVVIDLPVPTLNDNISDLGRLRKALEQKYGLKNITIAHDVLKNLARTLRQNDWKISVVISEIGNDNRIIGICTVDKNLELYGIAVDIGTTTIVESLINLCSGETIDTVSDFNKQISRGEDVISRILYADEKNGLDELNKLVVYTINGLIQELVNRNKIAKDDIVQCVFSGNTTMIHLFYHLDPKNIRLEPYIPTISHVPVLTASDLKINVNPHAQVHSIPGRASFVGGDITSDIMASGIQKEKEVCLLIDVGTNGEIVLGNQEWLTACSCSAGPAFEGGEVQAGSRAMAGAIEKVWLTKNLDMKFSTIGNIRPNGICGSGLIDLVAEMFEKELLDKTGKIQKIDSKYIRQGKRSLEFIIAFANDTSSGKDISIDDIDIKNIIRTKAAVYSATSVLLKKLDYNYSDVNKIFIAGGFGNYIDIDKAISIGLFPDVDRKKYVFIGNGSLGGARLILLSQRNIDEAEDIVKKMTYIELSTDNMFFDEYTSALFLPHTDIERFPSVKKRFDMQSNPNINK